MHTRWLTQAVNSCIATLIDMRMLECMRMRMAQMPIDMLDLMQNFRVLHTQLATLFLQLFQIALHILIMLFDAKGVARGRCLM